MITLTITQAMRKVPTQAQFQGKSGGYYSPVPSVWLIACRKIWNVSMWWFAQAIKSENGPIPAR